MKKMTPVCKRSISSDGNLRQKLKFLQTQYQVLSEKEQAEAGNEDKFFSSILSTLSDINHSISLYTSEKYKSELWSASLPVIELR